MESATDWHATVGSRSPRGSIAVRVAFAMALFGSVVAFVFTATTLTIFFWTEDEIFGHLAEVEADRLLTDEATPPIVEVFYESELPPMIARELANTDEGTHEINASGVELFVVIRRDNTGERRFVTYTVSGLEPNDGQFGTRVLRVCIGLGISIAIGSLLLAWWLARRVTSPLRDLAELVAAGAPDDLRERLEATRSHREVSVLVERLTKSLEALEEYREREKQFTRYASHELRTPVATIQGASELLRASDAPEHLLDRVDRAVSSMRSQIGTFLWLARSLSDDQLEARNLRVVLERVIGSFERETSQRRIAVSLSAPDVEIDVPSDAVIEIAVGNLLVNAISHSQGNTIFVSADKYQLQVSDNGVGMADDELERSLEEFVASSESDGHGLGLPIVQAICERLGWTFELESDSGSGTTARITFVAPGKGEA